MGDIVLGLPTWSLWYQGSITSQFTISLCAVLATFVVSAQAGDYGYVWTCQAAILTGYEAACKESCAKISNYDNGSFQTNTAIKKCECAISGTSDRCTVGVCT